MSVFHMPMCSHTSLIIAGNCYLLSKAFQLGLGNMAAVFKNGSFVAVV